MIASDGFSKADVKDFLIERAIIPAHSISAAQRRIMAAYLPGRFLGAGPEAGEKGLMVGLGPGFSAEMVLVSW